MKKINRDTRSMIENLLVMAVIFVLIPCLLLAGFFCWAWFTDRKAEAVAREIIDPKAAAYISQTYPENDYVLENAGYDFKDNCYRVNVCSQSSRDTYFALDFDYETYELIRDGYESSVLSGNNTRIRLVDEYGRLIDDCLSSVDCLRNVKSDFSEYSDNGATGGYFSPKGLDARTLILDQDYDVAALGSVYGYLRVTAVLPEEKVNILSALEILTEIDETLAENNVGYSLIDITIIDAEYPDTTAKFYLYDVYPEDLHRDDPLAYLQELWDTQEAGRQERKKQSAN